MFTALSSVRLDSILQFLDAMLAGAVGAAVELAVPDLHAVPNDYAPAVSALGSECMDRALKAIEHVSFVTDHDGKRLVIIISTDFTFGHISSFLLT
jgi:hypothetical protein